MQKSPRSQKQGDSLCLHQFKVVNVLQHPSHIPLMLGYHLGLRLGEAFGLMWSDIDFERKTVSINRQVQYDTAAKAWEFTAPKYDSCRTIAADDALIALLCDEYQRQQRAKAYYAERYQQVCVDKNGYLCASGRAVWLVNTRENGSYIQPRTMHHTSRVAHYQLGLPLFDYHTLRHTHTTLLLESGANPLDVQERLGHSTLTMTWRYAHNTDALREQTRGLLNSIYT